jgi:hypothetical protein
MKNSSIASYSDVTTKLSKMPFTQTIPYGLVTQHETPLQEDETMHLPLYNPPRYDFTDEARAHILHLTADTSSRRIFDISTQAVEEVETAPMRSSVRRPHFIFPPVYANQVFAVNDTHSLHTADQGPVGFEHDEWTRIWYNHEYAIDKYLHHSRMSFDSELLPWTYEHKYQGARYRLTIDSNRTFDDLPSFTHGKIIAFNKCNNWDYKYIIDHCVDVDEFNAYLKLICYDNFYDYYDICSDRPPLILVVPKTHCDVRMHPNLEENQVEPISNPNADIPLDDYLVAKSQSKESLWKRLLYALW